VTRTARLRAVKAIHTAIWLAVEAAMIWLLVGGVRGRSDRTAAVAAAVVGGEILVYLGNGARCPLTEVAESLGAESGSVTDIYLPRWFAQALPFIHVPLVAAAIALHARNLRGRRPRRL
jgi:hypothetical protein